MWACAACMDSASTASKKSRTTIPTVIYASKLPRFELVRLVQWRLDALPPTDAAVRQLAQQERDG